jgi:hypothetical protein
MFNTDSDKNRAFNIKNVKAGLDKNDFDTYAGKIMDSGLLNANGITITGIRKGDLVTLTREQYV